MSTGEQVAGPSDVHEAKVGVSGEHQQQGGDDGTAAASHGASLGTADGGRNNKNGIMNKASDTPRAERAERARQQAEPCHASLGKGDSSQVIFSAPIFRS